MPLSTPGGPSAGCLSRFTNPKGGRSGSGWDGGGCAGRGATIGRPGSPYLSSAQMFVDRPPLAGVDRHERHSGASDSTRYNKRACGGRVTPQRCRWHPRRAPLLLARHAGRKHDAGSCVSDRYPKGRDKRSAGSVERSEIERGPEGETPMCLHLYARTCLRSLTRSLHMCTWRSTWRAGAARTAPLAARFLLLGSARRCPKRGGAVRSTAQRQGRPPKLNSPSFSWGCAAPFRKLAIGAAGVDHGGGSGKKFGRGSGEVPMAAMHMANQRQTKPISAEAAELEEIDKAIGELVVDHARLRAHSGLSGWAKWRRGGRLTSALQRLADQVMGFRGTIELLKQFLARSAWRSAPTSCCPWPTLPAGSSSGGPRTHRPARRGHRRRG